jgi:HAD superfamily hydrolase (TIGR01662 family)
MPRVVYPRRQFLAQLPSEIDSLYIPTAFLDVDGTIRKTRSGRPFPRSADDVVILPGVADTIAMLKKMGYMVALVSNQAGIAHGQTDHETVQAAMSRTIDELRRENEAAVVDYYDYAEAYDSFRKPRGGMLYSFWNKLQGADKILDLGESFIVGDSAYRRPHGNEPGDVRPDGRVGTDHSNADRILAYNYHGLTFYEARLFFGWQYMQDLAELPFELQEKLKGELKLLIALDLERQSIDDILYLFSLNSPPDTKLRSLIGLTHSDRYQFVKGNFLESDLAALLLQLNKKLILYRKSLNERSAAARPSSAVDSSSIASRTTQDE